MEEIAAQRMMFHVLGRGFEHNAPSRDSFLIVQDQHAKTPGNFVKYPRKTEWTLNSSNHTDSLMIFSSFADSKSSDPVIIRKPDNQAFFSGFRPSSSDILDIQQKYCGNTGHSRKCSKSNRIILRSRICDGIKDCDNGEDEDGAMARNRKCETEKTLANGCCASLLVNGQEYVFKETYANSNIYQLNDHHVMFKLKRNWYIRYVAYRMPGNLKPVSTK